MGLINKEVFRVYEPHGRFFFLYYNIRLSRSYPECHTWSNNGKHGLSRLYGQQKLGCDQHESG